MVNKEERARQLAIVIGLKEKERDSLIERAQDLAARALDLKRQAEQWQEQIDRNRRELAELQTLEG